MAESFEDGGKDAEVFAWGRWYSPGAAELPCHRVVNKEGRTAPGWSKQRVLLEEEGVRFKPNGHVNMGRHQWEPEVG